MHPADGKETLEVGLFSLVTVAGISGIKEMTMERKRDPFMGDERQTSGQNWDKRIEIIGSKQV